MYPPITEIEKKNIFLFDSQRAILALEKFTTQGSLGKQAKETLNLG